MKIVIRLGINKYSSRIFFCEISCQTFSSYRIRSEILWDRQGAFLSNPKHTLLDRDLVGFEYVRQVEDNQLK